MDSCPQEILNLIIDKIAELISPDGDEMEIAGKMVAYSTISRRWVERTQFHNFRGLDFLDEEYLKKWCSAFAPKSNGISRHVRTIRLQNIDTLEGFEDHFRAFTLRNVIFNRCGIFQSLASIEELKSLGNRLTRVTIEELEVSPEVMAQFLSLLPDLREILSAEVGTIPDSVQISHPIIPFFRGHGSLSLVKMNDLEWIPEHAKFGKLILDRESYSQDPGVVNKWISSSRETLEDLWISSVEDGDGESNGASLGVSNPATSFCLPS